MANPFTPQPTDQAVEMLRMVFGSVMDNVVPGIGKTADTASSLMLAEAFRYFNSGVLMFGTLILTWVTIFGIANTANDGQALGKRWSTFFTPLRTFSAAAVLIPGSTGYAGIQIIMLIIVSYSIGFASNMWTGVVQMAVGSNIAREAAKSIVNDPNFDSIAVNALRMTLCAKGVNAAMASVSPDSNINLQYKRIDAPVQHTAQGDVYRTTFAFRDPNWIGSQSACGQIVMQNTYAAPDRSGSKLANDVAPTIKKAIYEVRARYVESLFNGAFAIQAQQVAANAATDGAPIDSTAIAQFIENLRTQQMNDIVREVGTVIDKENGGVLKTLTEKGWVYAGSMYREIGRIKDAVRNTTTSTSEFVAGATNPLESTLSGDSLLAANAVLTRYNAVGSELSRRIFAYESSNPTTQPTIPKLQSVFTAEDMTDGGGFSKSTITKYFNYFPNLILSGVVHYLEDPDADPVMKIKNVGDWMTTVVDAVMLWKIATMTGLKGAAAGAASSMIPGAAALAALMTGLSEMLAQFWIYVSPSITLIMYLGYFLGIWIPMVPFFIFATGVVGWLVFVVEMMAAGMLWAAAHTTPAREDSFIGSQTQGYMLVMSGFFRPALMVLGLVASNSLLYPITAYLNEAFLSQFRSLQADTVSGLFSLAGYIAIYCFLMSATYMLLFGLPQALPDNILRWIGAGIGDLGEKGMAGEVKGAASSQARQAAVWGASKGAAVDKFNADKDQKAERQQAAAAAEKTTQDRHDQLMSALGGGRNAPVGETGQSAITNDGR